MMVAGKRDRMAPDARAGVKTVATWGALVTVAGILIQVLFSGFYFGEKLEEKADRVELEAHKELYRESSVKAALDSGLILGELKGINSRLENIEQTIR